MASGQRRLQITLGTGGVNALCNVGHEGWLSDDTIVNAIQALQPASTSQLIEPTVWTAYVTGGSPPLLRRTVSGRLARDILIPVNVGNRHWILVHVNTQARTVRLLDSYATRSNFTHETSVVQTQVRNWLESGAVGEFGEEPWQLQRGYGPQQNDTYNCGVFVITAARRVLQEGNLEAPLNGDEERVRLAQELLDTAEHCTMNQIYIPPGRPNRGKSDSQGRVVIDDKPDSPLSEHSDAGFRRMKFNEADFTFDVEQPPRKKFKPFSDIMGSGAAPDDSGELFFDPLASNWTSDQPFDQRESSVEFLGSTPCPPPTQRTQGSVGGNLVATAGPTGRARDQRQFQYRNNIPYLVRDASGRPVQQRWTGHIPVNCEFLTSYTTPRVARAPLATGRRQPPDKK